MPQIVVRQLSDEVHIALKARAKRETRSAEAVARDILREALVPSDQLGFGHRLAAVWQGAEDTDPDPDLDLEREPYEPVELE